MPSSEDEVGGAPQAWDVFGYRVSMWNFGRSPEADLAIGAPAVDVGSSVDAGVVSVIYGKAGGIEPVAGGDRVNIVQTSFAGQPNT